MVNFDTREGIMKEWDAWVRYYRSGGGGTWPKDAFEGLLDYFDEQISQVSEKSSGGDRPQSQLQTFGHVTVEATDIANQQSRR